MAKLNIFRKMSPVTPTAVYDTFWRFAAGRQEVFFRRFHGEPPPWTSDSILAKHKFTNAYRASDRTSQYLIRNVIYRGDQSPQEVFFRIILFKIFNRESTWELLEKALGEIRYSTYSFSRYDDVLLRAMNKGERIFSAAYIMPSRSRELSSKLKHQNFLVLLGKMMADKVPTQLADANSMSAAYDLLRSYPLIGSFLAYQFVTDINYSTISDFSEMDFVIPGPGARDGIRKCFATLGDLSEPDIIRFVADSQSTEFPRRDLSFASLWGRQLQLIDCQNLFCEVAKYARIAHPEVSGVTGRTRIKQRFTPCSQSIDYFFPPKWGLNDRVGKERKIK